MNERAAHHTHGRRGLIGRVMRRSYERIGFHPLVPLLPGFLVGAAGPITLALYFEMSGGEFVRILLAAELGIWLPELIVASAIVRARARPLIAWIAGARGEEAATAAWRAGTTLPRDLLIHPLPYLVVATTALGFDFYAASELDLPAFGGGLVIFLGSVVQYAFWAVLRLFILEATLRPALEAVSEELPDGTHIEVPRMPLGRRLLISLPVMNLAAGTVLAGIFAGGEGTLGDFMLGVLGAVIVTLTISIWLIAFLSDSVASSMRDLRDGARRIGAGEFGGRVPIASTDETGELAQSFNEMAAGLAERERIREAFGTYVDRDVAEHILREGTSLTGEEVDVTMLFLDIRGFTTFAERLSAPEVVATLNRLFERIVPIIHEHSGHVDKYVGDGLLAVFGAPRRQEDHADQALAAALEIARAVEDEFGAELAVGIGLNSGPVVAGNVGGAGRLEFSVIGDAVNVAARVESATRQTGDRILIAGRTKELLRTGKITFVERPGLTLKGKTKPVEIYAPQGDSGPRADAVASAEDRDVDGRRGCLE
jgi:adenylate cyclase